MCVCVCVCGQCILLQLISTECGFPHLPSPFEDEIENKQNSPYAQIVPSASILLEQCHVFKTCFYTELTVS